MEITYPWLISDTIKTLEWCTCLEPRSEFVVIYFHAPSRKQQLICDPTALGNSPFEEMFFSFAVASIEFFLEYFPNNKIFHLMLSIFQTTRVSLKKMVPYCPENVPQLPYGPNLQSKKTAGRIWLKNHVVWIEPFHLTSCIPLCRLFTSYLLCKQKVSGVSSLGVEELRWMHGETTLRIKCRLPNLFNFILSWETFILSFYFVWNWTIFKNKSLS